MLAQVCGTEVCTVTQHDGGPHDFAQALIGQAKYRRLTDIRVAVDGRLDLQAADVLASANNDFLDAIDNIKKAVLVQVAHVAGVEPAFDESLGGGLGLIPVAHHVGWRLDTYLAPLARGQWLAVLAHYPELGYRRHNATGAVWIGDIECAGVYRAQGIGFGQAVADAGGRPLESAADLAHLVRWPRRAAGHDIHQRGDIAIRPGRRRLQFRRHGGHAVKPGDALLLNQSQRLLGIPFVHDHQLAPDHHGHHESRVAGGAVEQGNGQQPGRRIFVRQRALTCQLPGGHAHQHPAVERRQDAPVRGQGALGVPGGSGRVHDGGVVVRFHLNSGHGRATELFDHLTERGVLHDQAAAVVDGNDSHIVPRCDRHQALDAGAIGHHHPGAAVVKTVIQLLGGPPGVHRYGDRANGCHRDEGHHPLWIVAAENGNPVTLANAIALLQARRKRGAVVISLGIGITLLQVEDEILVPVAQHLEKILTQAGRQCVVVTILDTVDGDLADREGLILRGQGGYHLVKLLHCGIHYFPLTLSLA